MSIEIDWNKFPLVNEQALPKAWLSFEAYRGLAEVVGAGHDTEDALVVEVLSGCQQD